MSTRAASSASGRRSANLSVEVASGDALDIRTFSIKERLSSLFEVELFFLSDNPDLDFDAIVGQPATFSMQAGRTQRAWSGIVSHLEQTDVEETGLSGYRLILVPTLWLLTQRRNYRMFQQINEPDIVLRLLAEWGIDPIVKLDRSAYQTRKYRVQYAESDYAFMSRMLEDAGISFYFEDHDDQSRLVLSDAPQANEPRAGKLPFHDNPNAGMVAGDWVTKVKISKRVRPGKYTLADHDYRLPPQYGLRASASEGIGIEQRLERYHYTPGAFLFGTDKGEPTPSADDKGKTRSDEAEAARLARKRLTAKRGSAKQCTFETNAHDIKPGMVVHFMRHPRSDLGENRPLLIVESAIEGTFGGEWKHRCEARSAETPYMPALVTPKPKVNGVESATVVGPPGEEIHTDEFGRVRVHFHWDRESRMNDNSSCWIHVSQSWGGAGYGGVNLPRIGQEVLVDFLGGDPDRPVIVGRVYTNLQKVPYGLPANKTRSGLKSNSTGRTGGYNELMFEDAAGRELVNIQAERDLNKLVKNDETVAIGVDRTKRVGRDDTLSVSANRTKTVGGTERNVIGLSQTVSVGVNRSTQVGRIDSTLVGERYSLTVIPPGEGGAEQYLAVEYTAGGASISLVNGGPTITMTRDTPAGRGVDSGVPHVPNAITLDSGEGATIQLKKNAIYMHAARIVLYTSSSTPGSNNGDIVLQGNPMVQLNPS